MGLDMRDCNNKKESYHTDGSNLDIVLLGVDLCLGSKPAVSHIWSFVMVPSSVILYINMIRCP
jgi:hypothetical protein